MPENTLPFLDNEKDKKIYLKYFTSIKNDVLKDSYLGLSISMQLQVNIKMQLLKDTINM